MQWRLQRHTHLPPAARGPLCCPCCWLVLPSVRSLPAGVVGVEAQLCMVFSAVAAKERTCFLATTCAGEFVCELIACPESGIHSDSSVYLVDAGEGRVGTKSVTGCSDLKFKKRGLYKSAPTAWSPPPTTKTTTNNKVWYAAWQLQPSGQSPETQPPTAAAHTPTPPQRFNHSLRWNPDRPSNK